MKNNSSHAHDAIAMLIPVLTDCEAQYDSLKARDDVNWDCYKAGNWLTLVKLLNRAIKILEKDAKTSDLQDLETTISNDEEE